MLNKLITLTTKDVCHLKSISFRANPREVCALLFGRESSDFEQIILEVIQIPNLVIGVQAFAIRKADVNRAIKKSTHNLVAFYHSHPGDSNRLSSLDKENIIKSNLIWIVGAFKIDNENSFNMSAYEPEGLKILPVRIKIT